MKASPFFILIFAVASNAETVTLSHKHSSYDINVDITSPEFGHPKLDKSPISQGQLNQDILTFDDANPLWSAAWTSNTSTSVIDTDSSCSNGCEKSYSFSNEVPNTLTLIWDQIPLQENAPNVKVQFIITLLNNNLNIVPSFQVISNSGNDKELIGLWQWGLNIHHSYINDNNDNVAVFQPSSFGELHQGKGTVDYNQDYPSAHASMQYMAAYQEHDSSLPSWSNGIYFATHDSNGSIKTFSLTLSETQQIQFGVLLTPPNAGVQLNNIIDGYTPDFPIVISNFNGDWYDASLIYRDWVLPNSKWTQDGPIPTPPWFHQVTTWYYFLPFFI